MKINFFDEKRVKHFLIFFHVFMRYAAQPKGHEEILRNFDALSSISYITNSKIILDLTHLYIDIRNVGGNVLEIINNVPWFNVSEIHLSGMIVGKDGILHDGHGQPIPDEIWALFQLIHENYLKNSNYYITIEHTDVKWANTPHDYSSDFAKLEKILKKRHLNTKINPGESSDLYARNYLHKIISMRNNSLTKYLGNFDIDFHQITDEWISQLIDRTDKYIVLNRGEMLDDDKEAVLLQENFQEFVREKFK